MFPYENVYVCVCRQHVAKMYDVKHRICGLIVNSVVSHVCDVPCSDYTVCHSKKMNILSLQSMASLSIHCSIHYSSHFKDDFNTIYRCMLNYEFADNLPSCSQIIVSVRNMIYSRLQATNRLKSCTKMVDQYLYEGGVENVI